MNDKDKEAFEEWQESKPWIGDWKKAWCKEAWQAALEYERERTSLEQAKSNRLFVDMARKLCEAERELTKYKGDLTP